MKRLRQVAGSLIAGFLSMMIGAGAATFFSGAWATAVWIFVTCGLALTLGRFGARFL